MNQLAIYSKSVLSRSQNAFQIDNGSQVLTTVSLLLHNGFTRRVLSQFHNCVDILGRRGFLGYFLVLQLLSYVLKTTSSRRLCRLFSAIRIATSRRIFKPHFSKVFKTSFTATGRVANLPHTFIYHKIS